MKNVLRAGLLLLCLDTYAQNAGPFEFRNVGPSRGGRVTAVCGVVNDPGTFYMGATGGGLWKTTDYGFHWTNISDGYFATPSVGAIAVYQKDPRIIYVGTGSDGIRSNVIVGKGVYKSENAGKTWSFIGLKQAGQIGAVEIHPENPDIVFAAVVGQPFRKSKERGVYRTKDGGESWEQVLFLSDSVGAVDLEFAPGRPDIVYAAMWRAERKPWTIISGGAEDGIFKSADGGDRWERKTKGLPVGLTGKIDFAVSADKPERVWAQIQASAGEEGLYRSDDYAENWTRVELPEEVHKSIVYRPFYFTNLTANPGNADHLWAGTKDFWTSHDGGKNWTREPTPHADHHDLWINPENTQLMIEGNDGGAAVSRDGGRNWSTVFNQPTAELYSCHVDDQYPFYLYSGQQDNTTIRVPARLPYSNVLNSNDHHGLDQIPLWESVGGCETGPVIPKPGDPNTVYANCKGRFSVYNRITGIEQHYYIGAESLYGNHPDDITYRFQRVTPMEVSPHDPNTVYYGSQYLHKTVDGGVNWQKISPDLTANDPRYRVRSGGPIDEDISGEEYYAVLYAIRESPLQQGLIWTGSNDGLFFVTEDGGKNWENVTPDMPSGGRVSTIEVSPHNPAKAYYAVYRDYLGDDRPYLYSTDDYGKSWVKLTDGTNGIPADQPTRVVREDPDREGLLYAGTEFGLYVSLNDGKTWNPFQRNLPVTPVTDIRVHRKGLAISTLGRSFWILDDISPLHSFNIKDQGLRLFKPREVFGDVQFIYFTLPAQQKDTAVHFEFFRNGNLIHSKTEKTSDCPPGLWGIRKTHWDLRYYLADEEKDFQGPKVAPAAYTVKITYRNQSQAQLFQYRINPELEASGTSVKDLQEQEKLALETAMLLLAIKKKIRSLEQNIKATGNASGKKRLTTSLAMLKKGPERYDRPMLHEHVKYLYEMISESPQKLGRDAFARYETLKKQWENLKDR
ncbi:MAG: hypothetical protein MI921_01690 [Cytophagales bacterium]|nr:hypothetical protein [Cytophagales bacterium]